MLDGDGRALGERTVFATLDADLYVVKDASRTEIEHKVSNKVTKSSTSESKGQPTRLRW